MDGEQEKKRGKEDELRIFRVNHKHDKDGFVDEEEESEGG